ncbi:MAG TPA: VIT domain-containing protein, partial [Candidatus Thermoplasmatota archaeon]|nr:VIT domain-containing protein [Candidatus Thermoplasmatota archaeon]
MRLALAFLVLLLAPAAFAQASTPPPTGTVWTVMTTVEATVQGNYAVVKVIADIGNRGPDPEFPFLVRVPDDAFVTGLTIERDGQVFEARIEERAKARAEYEAHKQAQQTGGLVEKQRRSQLYQYLINVAEFTSVRATLTYEQHLAADRGVYNVSLEAPVSGFGQDLGAQFR